jgi:hypothetical protein
LAALRLNRSRPKRLDRPSIAVSIFRQEAPVPAETFDQDSPSEAKASPIRVSLNDYDELFSDFDGRSLNERLVSDDFLQELRRACLDRASEGLTLLLSLPRRARKAPVERVVRERLREHLSRQRRRLEERLGRDRALGGRLLALGVLLMFGAAWLHHASAGSFAASFVIVLLEPAGWFTFWEGLSLLLFRARDAGPELAFYRKVGGAQIRFVDEAAVPR